MTNSHAFLSTIPSLSKTWSERNFLTSSLTKKIAGSKSLHSYVVGAKAHPKKEKESAHLRDSREQKKNKFSTLFNSANQTKSAKSNRPNSSLILYYFVRTKANHTTPSKPRTTHSLLDAQEAKKSSLTCCSICATKMTEELAVRRKIQEAIDNVHSAFLAAH